MLFRRKIALVKILTPLFVSTCSQIQMEGGRRLHVLLVVDILVMFSKEKVTTHPQMNDTVSTAFLSSLSLQIPHLFYSENGVVFTLP